LGGAASGLVGSPGPGEHDVSLVGTNVALHVPASTGAPMPLLILLHGQGDTGRNFLNVYMYKGLPKDLILAAPDANDDATALALETKLKTMFDVDTKREYALGFSQGGGYAAFLLFDASSANRFAAIALASSGLAENPAYIPAASPGSPGVAVVIDPQDMNNTWGQGRTVMQDFVVQMQNKGYQAKIWLHNEGHKLAPTETQAALAWMFTQAK
jgi:poly(3-hydroxybutyrate) depolymerase